MTAIRTETNKVKLLYLHGLGKPKRCEKFDCLESYFNVEYEVKYIRWDEQTNMSDYLNELDRKFAQEENLIVLGNSTGANFAWQLKELRKKRGVNTCLIAISPLFSVNNSLVIKEFPDEVKKCLKDINNLDDSMVIIGSKDSVLNHAWLEERKWPNTEIVRVRDTHRLNYFHKYISTIDKYIQKGLPAA